MLHLALSGSLFDPDFTISDIPTAGDNFNFTCTVRGVAERLISGTYIEVRIIKPTGAGGSPVEESVYVKRYILNPTRTNDAGRYRCIVTVFEVSDPHNAHASSRSRDLQIRSNSTVVHFCLVCVYLLLYQFLLLSLPLPSLPPLLQRMKAALSHLVVQQCWTPM